ncbi:MAG: SDR family oxidoreductase [Pseudomonadota bacterium]
METVVITGANRGIGLELTRQFAANGWRVLAGCRAPDQASDLRRLAETHDVQVQTLDVANAGDVGAFRDKLGDQTIDVLINNAGVFGGDRQSQDDMDYDAWLDAFDVNTLAPFRLAMALKPNLARSGRPRIVTISSQMGALSRESKGSFAYRSSKAAVNKVMQVLALELESEGIVACPVHPGWVRTDMGGAAADLSALESAAGLADLVANLTMEQSGKFWTWEGEELDW